MLQGDTITVVMRDGKIRITGQLMHDLDPSYPRANVLLNVEGRRHLVPAQRILWIEEGHREGETEGTNVREA